MTLVFNGDFNCFNVDHADFSAIHRPVARHHATLGNVKAELGADGAQARCGCAYPGHVDEDVSLIQTKFTPASRPQPRHTLVCWTGWRACISTRPNLGYSLHSTQVHSVWIDVAPTTDDLRAWVDRFRANWPEGSPAWLSCYERISTAQG